jgi:hypothetical protein
MPRFLVTLALVFAQALPWAGGPVFVCTERDGSVCLDGGPLNCNCCVTDAGMPASCDDEHGAATPPSCTFTHSSAEFGAAPCDCEHQLWEAAPTTLAGRAVTGLADRPADAVFALPAAMTPILASQAEACSILRGPSAGAAERILSCVVLRC